LRVNTNLCSSYQIVKYPTFVLFKSAASVTDAPVQMTENWYEVYYGSRVSAPDLASFVTDNARTRVRTLTRLSANIMADEMLAQDKIAFFVDFFAPVYTHLFKKSLFALIGSK
jgi:hypothetical protein